MRPCHQCSSLCRRPLNQPLKIDARLFFSHFKKNQHGGTFIRLRATKCKKTIKHWYTIETKNICKHRDRQEKKRRFRMHPEDSAGNVPRVMLVPHMQTYICIITQPPNHFLPSPSTEGRVVEPTTSRSSGWEQTASNFGPFKTKKSREKDAAPGAQRNEHICCFETWQIESSRCFQHQRSLPREICRGCVRVSVHNGTHCRLLICSISLIISDTTPISPSDTLWWKKKQQTWLFFLFLNSWFNVWVATALMCAWSTTLLFFCVTFNFVLLQHADVIYKLLWAGRKSCAVGSTASTQDRSPIKLSKYKINILKVD